MTLGKMLKRARTKMGLSQVELADAVGVVQGTISAWENEKQVPTREHRVELVTKLQLDRTHLDAAADEAEAKLRQSKVLSARDYLQLQQEYLDSLGEDRKKLKICFLGPENLPVLDYTEVQDIWIENLRGGTDYVILWFLCLVQEGALRDLAWKLNDIGRRAQAGQSGHGSIYHYGLRVLENNHDSHFRANATDFLGCSQDSLVGNHFVKLWLEDDEQGPDLDEVLKRKLLRQYLAQGTVVVYFQPSFSHQPLASLSLDGVCTIPDSEERDAFFFLGARHSAALWKLMRDFFNDQALTKLNTPEESR